MYDTCKSMFTVEPARSQLWLNSGDTDGKHWEKLLKRAREHPLNHAVYIIVHRKSNSTAKVLLLTSGICVCVGGRVCSWAS